MGGFATTNIELFQLQCRYDEHFLEASDEPRKSPTAFFCDLESALRREHELLEYFHLGLRGAVDRQGPVMSAPLSSYKQRFFGYT